VITAPSTTSVAAASPAAVHRPRAAEPVVCAATDTGRALAETPGDADGDALLATLLSGGTRVPTGLTLGAALKPQSSRDAASR